MNRKSKNIIAASALLLASTAVLRGQQAVVSAGGGGSVQGVTVSWSIGEPVSGAGGGATVLTQGVQQPRLSVVSGLPELPGMTVTVFPNPASERVTIRLNGNDARYVAVSIIDPAGRVRYRTTMNAGELEIPVSDLPPGLYIISLTDQLKNMQTFKLIKK